MPILRSLLPLLATRYSPLATRHSLLATRYRGKKGLPSDVNRFDIDELVDPEARKLPAVAAFFYSAKG